MSEKDNIEKKYGNIDDILGSSDTETSPVKTTRKKSRRVNPALAIASGEAKTTKGIDRLNDQLVEAQKALEKEKESHEKERQALIELHEKEMSISGKAKPFTLVMPVTKQEISFTTKEIDPSLIDVSPENERIQEFLDEVSLHDILPSIKKEGQQKPGTVRPKANGRYELIEGSRRLAGVKLAKKKYIAFVGDVPDADVRHLAEIENTHKDVSPYEKALSFQKQIDEGVYRNWSQIGVAKGISESHIHRYKSCADLPEIFVSILLSPSDMPLSYGETVRSLLKKNSKALYAAAEEVLAERNSNKSIEAKMDIDGVIKFLKSSVRTKQNAPTAKKPLLYKSDAGAVLKHSLTSKGDTKFELKGVDEESLKKITDYLIKTLGVK